MHHHYPPMRPAIILRYALLLVAALWLIPGAASPPGAMREIVDMAGQRILVPQEIRKVGTLGSVPMINTLIEALGAGTRICNRPSSFHDIFGRWKMHLEFAPQLVGNPFFQSASHELLIENILRVQPDVCITMTRNIADTLNNRGIPTLYIHWNSVDSMMDSVRLLGEVLNQQRQAEEYIRYFQDSREKLKALSADIPEQERKSVLYSNPMMFRLPGSLTEELLAAAGARSVSRKAWQDGARQFDMEDLLYWDPDFIFTSNRNAINELRRDPRLKTLRAVANDRVIDVPVVGHMWGGHTVEAPVVGFWIFHRLYPQRMRRETLVREIRYFYRHFFHYDMSDEQIITITGGRIDDEIQTAK
jgi:iron complex transport system substrate-binding protein